MTLLVSKVPIFPCVSSKLGQFPEEASLRQLIFAVFRSSRFAGVKAQTDERHSIMIPAETLDLEWQVR